VVAPAQQSKAAPGAAPTTPVEKNVRVSAASKDAAADEVPALTF
jgi:hypothetical protein